MARAGRAPFQKRDRDENARWGGIAGWDQN